MISWTQSEIAEIDRKIRRTLNTGLHPRTDIYRLYAPRNKGGRGFKQVEYAILSEQMALEEHVNDKT